MGALDTVKFPPYTCQPGVVEIDLLLTGATGANPTFAASKDNDNRLITSMAAYSQGTMALTMAKSGRVLLNATASFNAATQTYALRSASMASGVVTLVLCDLATPTAVELKTGDTMSVTLRFKNSGA